MGEVADMMIEGEMCPCGEYMGEGDGFQRYCSDQCARDYGGVDDPLASNAPREAKPKRPRKHPCPACGKAMRSAQGVLDHVRDKHGGYATFAVQASHTSAMVVVAVGNHDLRERLLTCLETAGAELLEDGRVVLPPLVGCATDGSDDMGIVP